MSEEEIIKDLTKYISFANKSENFSNDNDFKWNTELSQRVQSLLDLYNKEKEKNKDKIKEKIKQLEKEQEQNCKELARGIDYLSKEMIEASSKKIEINLSIRKYLQELLEGDK